MAKRSVAITLINNTQFLLQHFWEAVCHGSWGPVTGTPAPGPAAANASLPETIGAHSVTTWSTADAEFSIFRGTEAWVKYSVLLIDASYHAIEQTANLLYIYWNNPYTWSDSTTPIVKMILLSEGTLSNPSANFPNGSPPCQQGDIWPGLSGNITADSTPAVEIFSVSNLGSSLPTYNFGSSGAGPGWDVFIDWPGLLAEGLIDAEKDLNLSFTLGLRELGSVAQSIKGIYDGSKGLRALAIQSNQTSLKKLFGM